MFKKLIATTILLFSTSAFAFGGFAGGGLGYSDVSLDDYDAGISVSGRVGMVFSEHMTLGLGLASWSDSFESGTSEATISIIPFLVEFNYHVSSVNSGFFIGANAGIVQETVTIEILGTETTDDETESGIGLQLGYNFPLAARHSIGGELKHVMVSADPKDYDFTSLNVNYNFWWGDIGGGSSAAASAE